MTLEVVWALRLVKSSPLPPFPKNRRKVAA
jgi:hypothetical protein